MVCEIIGYYGILDITISVQGLSAGQDLQTSSSLHLCDSKPIICCKNSYMWLMCNDMSQLNMKQKMCTCMKAYYQTNA